MTPATSLLQNSFIARTVHISGIKSILRLSRDLKYLHTKFQQNRFSGLGVKRQAITWVEKIPYIGPKLEEPLLEFLKNQKARLHKNAGAEMESQGSILSSLLEKFVLAMVLYFVVSIVHALAQNYSKRIGKKKGKKKE